MPLMRFVFFDPTWTLTTIYGVGITLYGDGIPLYGMHWEVVVATSTFDD